jgi:hypothetical protein
MTMSNITHIINQSLSQTSTDPTDKITMLKHNIMKMYVEVEVKLHMLLTLALDVYYNTHFLKIQEVYQIKTNN